MDSVTARKNLEKARLEMHYTQLKMSELLDISLPAYRRLEKGGTRIVNENYVKAAEILEKNLDKMLSSQEEEEEHESLADGRWDARDELVRIERLRREEREAYEKRLEEKERLIGHLMDLLETKEKELKEKEETINYQNQKIAEGHSSDGLPSDGA